MKSYFETILLIILIILTLIYLFSTNVKEHFETYSYGPFNYMDSGSDPLTFYKYPVYRNPYMYPYKFYSSYPYPYLTYGNVNI
jgi:cbb3-type cytochrome oxidase subunit 3